MPSRAPRRTQRTRRYKRSAYRSSRKTYKRSIKVAKKNYYFTRHCARTDLDISNSIFTLTGYNFSLNDLPNYTEFTALYDMYKINAVKISFIPQMTQNISLGAINNAYASTRFLSAIDYNDGSAPSSSDDIREYQSCKITPILRTHTRFIRKPKILDSSGYSISPWLSTASPAVDYFGLKVAVEPMNSTSTETMTYTVECKYYLAFKNVK